MTVKVGDKVRCLMNKGDVTKGHEYIVAETDGYSVRVTDDVGDMYWLCSSEYETITEPQPTLSTQIRARMEHHMIKGEYVRAVKWAQIAELVEELEDETD